MQDRCWTGGEYVEDRGMLSGGQGVVHVEESWRTGGRQVEDKLRTEKGQVEVRLRTDGEKVEVRFRTFIGQL